MLGMLLIDLVHDTDIKNRLSIIVAIGTIASGISAIIMSHSTICASQLEAISR